MKADQLRIDDLLDVPPTGGVLRFGGRRSLLLDAVALGLLRSQLVETFGVTVTKGLLTRLGYTHGVRTAEALRDAIEWDDPHEWRIAGGRLHRLQGMVTFEPVAPAMRLDATAFAEALWRESYEAEQHTQHLGRADEPVCWTLTGFASGYLSHVNGEPIYCVEERCVGRGDAVCHMVGRTAADWGERLESVQRPFQKDCLDAALGELRTTLLSLEADLRERRRVLEIDDDAFAARGLVVRSPAMRRVMALAEKAAKVDATVLVTGESGVGKERVARFLHDESTRCGGPFVAVDCGALPETLLEAELFGHKRGAFTGATHDRAGLFEAAHGGTLFLDEIGELPNALQSRLLRVLQEREVRRLGENLPRPIDVRLVSATNRRLPEMVDAGAFRQDLYYRLQVVEIAIPPLRERVEDILPLARQALRAASARMGREVAGIDAAAARRLAAYRWPGNVRELANVIERAVLFGDGETLRASDLSGMDEASSLRPGSLAEVERQHILRVLDEADQNRARAAERLGISQATLFRRLRAYRR